MKKTIKIPLYTVLAILLLVLCAGAFFTVMMKREISKMAPLETQEVIPGVFAVKDSYVNMYIVKTGGTFIALDAGNDSTAIKKELERLNIKPDRIFAVFLTHSDNDHTAGVEIFKNALIYIPAEEEQMITKVTPRFGIFYNKPIDTYRILKNGDEVIMPGGMTISLMSAPGHTPGSACYIVNNTMIFTGDTLSLKDGKADTFNEFFNMDTDMQKMTLKKLAVLKGIQYIFTAHYGMSSNFNEAFAQWK